MATNFNDSIPAAPTTKTNVKWQTDGSGKISAYVDGQVATPINLVAQTANIGSTLLYAVPSTGAGMYRISVFIIVTQVATTSSTLPEVDITFTDNDNNTSQTLAMTVTNTGNLLTTYEEAVEVVNVKASTNINFSTTGTTTVGATPLNYALHIRIEGI